MHLALLARYLDGDLWEARLCAAVPEEPLPVDEFNALSALSGCTAAYDAAVVALDGPDGLTAVRELRRGRRCCLSSGLQMRWNTRCSHSDIA